MAKAAKHSKEQMTHIFGNYYLDSDAYQFILRETVERKRKKTNETYESAKTLGYFTSVSGALKYCMLNETKLCMSQGDAKELKDMIKFMDELTQRIERSVRY